MSTCGTFRAAQTALFLCTGANLTLRNCSITILNHTAGTPFSLDPDRDGCDTCSQSRSGLKAAWCAGGFTEGFRLSGGPCDVVLRDSVVAARGGPLVRFDGAEAAPESRVFLVQSLVAGPGPIIDSTENAVGLEQAAGRSVPSARCLGRLHGRGHRERDCRERFGFKRPAKQIDWSGEANLFAGWKGFFACGRTQDVTVADLAAARSTWNGTDLTSREILAHLGASRGPGGGNAGRLFVVRAEPSRHSGARGAAPRRPV